MAQVKILKSQENNDMNHENLFLNNKSLPKDFTFPQEFIAFVSQKELPNLHPWWLLYTYEGAFDAWLKIVRKQYPSRSLIPFAKIEYTDDIACFDGLDFSGNPKVFYVHSYASPGWEDRGCVNNFSEWLKYALEDAEEYQREDNE